MYGKQFSKVPWQDAHGPHGEVWGRKTVPVVKPGNGKKNHVQHVQQENPLQTAAFPSPKWWKSRECNGRQRHWSVFCENCKPRQILVKTPVGCRSSQWPVAAMVQPVVVRGWQGQAEGKQLGRIKCYLAGSTFPWGLGFVILSPLYFILYTYKYLPHRGPQDEQIHYQTRFCMGMCHTW